MARRSSLIGLVLFFVTFAVFSRVLMADFVKWDDDNDIYQNPHLSGLSLETLRWMFTDLRYIWRYTPLVWLTREIIFTCQGMAPLGYHLASLVFHSLSAVWLFLLIRKLLSLALPAESQAAPAACRLVCPALGALLWAVHPLRVEAVAWAAGYPHCQSVFFMLLSLWLYLEAVTARATGGKRWRYWLSVVFYLASLLSFPSTLGLVPLLVILDVYPLKRFGRGPGRWWNASARRIWLEKVPFLALALLAVGLALLVRLHPQPRWSQPVSLAQFGLSARAMQACYVWAYFLWKPWAPFHLCPVYTTLVEFDPRDWPFLLSAGLVLGLTVLVVWNGRRWPLVLALWLGYLALLVPVLGLTEHPHYPSDRYSYLPAILWSVLLAAALLKLCRRPRTFVAAAAALVCLVAVLGAMSVRQTRIWRDSASLFEYMLATLGNDPYRAEIHWRLGEVYARQRKLEQAISQFQESLRLNPDDAETRNNLGVALGMTGHRDQAIAQYQEALRLKPDYSVARENLDAALRLQRDSRKPDSAEAHNDLGIALAQKENPDEAITQFREALKLNPRYAEAHFNLGLALAGKGRLDEAIAQYQEAVSLKPGYAKAHHYLGAVLAGKRRLDEAISHYEAAIKAKPDYAEAHNDLGAALVDKGQLDEAISHFREAVKLKPDYTDARKNLDVVLGMKSSLANPSPAAAKP